MFYKPDINCWE